jgi:hypothetical protein
MEVNVSIIPQLLYLKGKSSPQYSLDRRLGLVGTRAGLDLVMKKIFSPCWESNSGHQPIA